MVPVISQDDSGVDRTVAGLYRAAAAELPWRDALAGISAVFGAWGVQLLGIQAKDGAIAFSHDVGGPTPEAALDYFCRWHRMDPRTGLLKELPLGRWISCHEHFDDAFVAVDPFYRDYLIPNGGRYISAARIYEDDGVQVMMGIHRGHGSLPLAAPERALGERIGLHVQTALGLWRRRRHTLQEALVGQALLARLTQPVLLLDAEARVVHANDSAREQIDGGDARLAVRAGRLVCHSMPSHLGLLEALRSLGDSPARGAALAQAGSTLEAAPFARRGSSVGQYAELPGRTLLRAADPGGRLSDLLLLVSPLRAAETMGAFGSQNVALVLLQDAAARRWPDPLLIATAYGLTPAEAHVASRIAAGESPKFIARVQAVSVHTVRSQLGTVFAKVGVRRQSELAAVLSAIPPAAS